MEIQPRNLNCPLCLQMTSQGHNSVPSRHFPHPSQNAQSAHTNKISETDLITAPLRSPQLHDMAVHLWLQTSFLGDYKLHIKYGFG